MNDMSGHYRDCYRTIIKVVENRQVINTSPRVEGRIYGAPSSRRNEWFHVFTVNLSNRAQAARAGKGAMGSQQ